MPRQIEEELIDAIRAGRLFSKRHHTYDPDTGIVRLYGNAIIDLARGEPGIALWASLGGWNTPRTRQTINAVARALAGRACLTVQNFQPYAGGRRVSVTEWFPVQNARQGPQTAATAPILASASR